MAISNLRNFEHEARWNEEQRRIEMHLRSRVNQTAFIAEAGLTVTFRAGETIWTESSHNSSFPELDADGGASRLQRAKLSGSIASGRSRKVSGPLLDSCQLDA